MKSIVFLFLVQLYLFNFQVLCYLPSSQCNLQIDLIVQGIQGSLCSSQGYISNFTKDISSRQNLVNYALSFWIKPQANLASSQNQIIAVIHSNTDQTQLKQPYLAIIADKNYIISVILFSNGAKVILNNSNYQKDNDWNYILVTVSQAGTSNQRVAIIYNSMNNLISQSFSQIDIPSTGQIKLTLLSRFDSDCLKSTIGGFFFIQNIDINQSNWESEIFNYFLQGGIFVPQIQAWYSTRFQDDTSVIPDLSGNLRYLIKQVNIKKNYFNQLQKNILLLTYQAIIQPQKYFFDYPIGLLQRNLQTFQDSWQQYSQQDMNLFNNFMISFWIKPITQNDDQYLIITVIDEFDIVFDLLYKFNSQLNLYQLFTSGQSNSLYTSSNIKVNQWVKVLLKIYFDPLLNSHVIYVEENDSVQAVQNNVSSFILFIFKNLSIYSKYFNQKITFSNLYYQKSSLDFYVGFGHNPYFKHFILTQGAFTSNSNNKLFNPQGCSYLRNCSSILNLKKFLQKYQYQLGIQGILGSQYEYCTSCISGSYFDGSSMQCYDKCPQNKEQINEECSQTMYNWYCKKFDVSQNKCLECNDGRNFNSDKSYCQCQQGYFDDRIQNICQKQFRHSNIYTGQFNFVANKQNKNICSEQQETTYTKYICIINDSIPQKGQIITSVVGLDMNTLDNSQNIIYQVIGYIQQPNIVIQIKINDDKLILNEFMIQYMVIQDQYLYQINHLLIDFTSQKKKSLSTILTINQNFLDEYSISVFLSGATILPILSGQSDNLNSQISSKFNYTSLIQSTQQIFNLEFTVSQRIQMLQYQILYMPNKQSYDHEIDLSLVMDKLLQSQNLDKYYSPLFQYEYFFSQPFNFNDIFLYGLSSFSFSYPNNNQINSNQFTYSLQNTEFQLQPLNKISISKQDMQLYTQQQYINSIKISLTAKNASYQMSNLTLSLASSFSKCSKNCLSCQDTPELCSICSNSQMDISFPYCTKCLPNYISQGILQCRVGQKCGNVQQQVILNCKQCNPYSREALCQQCVDGYQPNQFYTSCEQINQSQNKTISCHSSCSTCLDSSFYNCKTCSSSQNNILISGTCYCNFYSYRFKLNPDCEVNIYSKINIQNNYLILLKKESVLLKILFKFEYIFISFLVFFSITQTVLQQSYHLLWRYIEVTQMISSFIYFNVYGLTLLDFVYRLTYLYNLSPIFPNPFMVSILYDQNFEKLINNFSQDSSSRFFINYKSSELIKNIIPSFLFYLYLLILVFIKQFILFRTRKNAFFFQDFKGRIFDALFFGFYLQSQELIMLIFMSFSQQQDNQFFSTQSLVLAAIIFIGLLSVLFLFFSKIKSILARKQIIQLIGDINNQKKYLLYWPIIRISSRFVISALLIFLQNNPKTQACLIFIFAFTYVYFYKLKPYQNSLTQIRIQRYEIILLIVLLLMCLVLLIDNQQFSYVGQIIILIIIIIQLIDVQILQFLLIILQFASKQSNLWKRCQIYLIKLNIIENENDQQNDQQGPNTNISDLSMELQNNLSSVNNQIFGNSLNSQNIQVQWQVNPINAYNKKQHTQNNQ